MGREIIDATETLGKTPGYSYAARSVGGVIVYTAGAVPLDREGKLVGAGNLEEQTRVVIDNLNAALEAAGVSSADVLKTTIYVVGQEREDLSRAWRVFAATDLAAAPSTLVGVALLGYDAQLVEIEAVAADSRPPLT